MTKLLERALKEVEKLSEEEQDAVAAILLDELASEQRWAVSFAGSQAELGRIAKQALVEYKRRAMRNCE